ncbi:MAG: hypothetical protein ACFFCF_03485 [Promethearchaeota archaeon]
MNGFIADEIPFKDFIFQLVIPFLVTLFFLQSFRTYVVNLYISFFNILWEGTGNYIPLLTLLAFGAPLLAVLIYRKISLSHMIIGSAILTAIFATPISLQLAYEIEILFSSMVVAFYAIFLPFYLYSQSQNQHVIGHTGKAALLAVSFIIAFSFDVLFRAFGTTSDISRTLPYFPLQLVFAIIVIGLGIWKNQQSPKPSTNSLNTAIEEHPSLPLTSRLVGLLTIAGFGAFLFLEHSLFLSPHNLLRSQNPPYFLIDITIILISILSIQTIVGIILLHKRGRNMFDREKWYTIAITNLIIIMAFPGFFFWPSWFYILTLMVINFFLLSNLYYILQFSLHPRHRWSVTILCIAIFIAFLFFLLWDFLFAFTFTYAYLGDIGSIFVGQTLTLIWGAFLILGTTSTYAVYKLRRLDQ